MQMRGLTGMVKVLVDEMIFRKKQEDPTPRPMASSPPPPFLSIQTRFVVTRKN